jgi:hypothetical protein
MSILAGFEPLPVKKRRKAKASPSVMEGNLGNDAPSPGIMESLQTGGPAYDKGAGYGGFRWPSGKSL